MNSKSVNQGLTRRDILKASTFLGLGLLMKPKSTFASSECGIQIIIPSTPGGFGDINTRLITKHWVKRLDCKFSLTFSPGARTIIAMDQLARSPADGRTLAQNLVAQLASVLVFEDPPFKANDFIWLGTFNGDVIGLFVRKATPWKTIEEFINELKSRPKDRPMTIGVGGALSPDGICAKVFLEVAGEGGKVVPFAGGSQSRGAALGGQIDALVSNVEPVIGMKDEFRGLGVFAKHNPASAIFDMPPIKRIGNKELPVLPDGSQGIMTRAAVRDQNPDFYAKLVTSFRETIKDPAYVEEVSKRTGPHFISYLGPEETWNVQQEFMKGARAYAKAIKG